MNNRKAKQVKTPNLIVQRTVLGVEDHVHAKALQRIDALTADRDELLAEFQSLSLHHGMLHDELAHVADRYDGVYYQWDKLKGGQLAKCVAAGGAGFALGIAVGAGRILVGLM